jgi:hypothetical protein
VCQTFCTEMSFCTHTLNLEPRKTADPARGGGNAHAAAH